MQRPAVLLVVFVILCILNGVAIFFLVSSARQGSAEPRYEIRRRPAVGAEARRALVLPAAGALREGGFEGLAG